MSRMFRRGELKEAVLIVTADLGEAHGYAVMTELQTRVGAGWQASPGSVYPALLALVDAGWLTTDERDDVRLYRVTAAGRRAAEQAQSTSRWASLGTRAASHTAPVTLGTVLDRIAANARSRRRHVPAPKLAAVEQLLEHALDDVDAVLDDDPAADQPMTMGGPDG